jgi:formylglycine-generating enzyme required for sulfatase activity
VPLSEGNVGDLSGEQWQDLVDRAGQLEKVLSAGAISVDLGRFLPPPEARHRRAVLHELIKTELEARYRHHQGCLLEEFIRRYPELGGVHNLPAGLLYEEYRLRLTFGDPPSLEEYQDRFPRQFDEFQQQVNLNPPTIAPGQTLTPRSSPVVVKKAPDVKKVDVAAEQKTSSTVFATVRPALTPSSNSPQLPASSSRKSSTTSSSQVLLPPGEGYELLERVGKGAFGEVYRARAPGGVIVAVKRMFHSWDDEASQRELKALNRIRELRHPFLLQTHSYRAYEDRLVIVMELADGSLQDRFNECRAAGLPGIPLDALLQYFTEAAEALDFLQKEKLSHRDIKPQNLLHLKGHAKVADFGLARVQEATMEHTMSGCGTPAYMAPEMWQGDISIHSDQYSFAMTWYQMRTGLLAFTAKNRMELFNQHQNEKPNVSEVPEKEQKVLLRALSKNPDKRFPGCVAFVEALKEASAPPKPPAPSRAPNVKVLVASLAAVLIAFSIGAWLIWPAKPLPPAPWLPEGWEAESASLVQDRQGHEFYQRLKRSVGGQDVVMVAILQKTTADLPTFYAMENKVSNDFYGVFMADPRSEQLFAKYKSRPGCDKLVSPGPLAFLDHDDEDELDKVLALASAIGLADSPRGPNPFATLAARITGRRLPLWCRGGYAPEASPPSLFLGFAGPKGRLPVFRVTPTEAHCFAEWLGGRLPSKRQWLESSGLYDDHKNAGPFEGDINDRAGLAVASFLIGPRPIDWGPLNVSPRGCRQMAGNGFEWTRDLIDKDGEIPLEEMRATRQVIYLGQSYLNREPATFESLKEERAKYCTEASYDIGFRVVIEPP